ncbi:MAG: V-type ATPase subunit [Candidatus Margulisbacteria bacterium]|jgi:vacuolar-type H+-ATPase subunit C/Vma6|nr:V-type ATPase subunit [Candidatus Margulisiibacteriota bacterium]
MSSPGYLLGRVRSREGRLLTAADWQKYQTAADLADWLSRLQNTDYAAAAEHAGTYEQFEKYLNQELQNLREDLFAQKYPFAELFWQKYDLHNLKILLKEKLTGQDLNRYLLPLGQDSLAAFDRQTVREAEAVYARTLDFCRMDYFLDQTYLRWLSKRSAGLGRAVKAYARAQIDAANFKLWYSGAAPGYAYFAGGGVSVSLLAQGTPQETLRACFPGITPPEEFNDGAVEKALEDYASRLLFAGRYACDIAAVFCYLLSKENEIKNLKTMYLRQSRQLAGLQSCLRAAYV